MAAKADKAMELIHFCNIYTGFQPRRSKKRSRRRNPRFNPLDPVNETHLDCHPSPAPRSHRLYVLPSNVNEKDRVHGG